MGVGESAFFSFNSVTQLLTKTSHVPFLLNKTNAPVQAQLQIHFLSLSLIWNKTSADPVLRCTTVCTLPFASPPPATISSSPNVSTVDPTMTTALSAGTPARCWSSRRSGTSPSSSWPPPSSSQRCASGRLRRSDSGSAATRSSAFFIWLSSSLSSEAEFAIPFLTLPIGNFSLYFTATSFSLIPSSTIDYMQFTNASLTLSFSKSPNQVSPKFSTTLDFFIYFLKLWRFCRDWCYRPISLGNESNFKILLFWKAPMET